MLPSGPLPLQNKLSIYIKEKDKHLRTRVGPFNNRGVFIGHLIFFFHFSTIECRFKQLTFYKVVTVNIFQCKFSSMSSSNIPG